MVVADTSLSATSIRKVCLKVSVASHGSQKSKIEVITANYELKDNSDLVDMIEFSK